MHGFPVSHYACTHVKFLTYLKINMAGKINWKRVADLPLIGKAVDILIIKLLFCCNKLAESKIGLAQLFISSFV